MSDIAALVADNLDIWTNAIERRSSSGRGSSKKISLYGIERLRALILDLAVRGQLVAQDADDEPASKLLDRISKARKAFDPKFKLPNLSKTEVDEAKVPTNWVRVCLAELAKPQAGFAFKSKFFNEAGDGLALIRIRDVGQPFTGTYYSGEYRPEFEVEFGDYLISMDGEFRVATWEGDKALLNQRVTRLQFFETDLERSFVAIALQQELTKLQGVKAYTTVDHLSGKQIAASQIPVPPLAEQKRIVAKVDELMALCDALEQESENALTAHQTLVETLLATLVNSTDASDLAKSWARLENHFDTLFTTEASINALKQTILDLAVRGTLVERDANEDAVFGGLRQIKEELPFATPSGWQWVPFSEVAEFKNGDRSSKYPKRSEYVSEGMPWINTGHIQPDGTLSKTNMFFISDEKFASLGGGKIQPGDLVYCLRGATFGKTAFVEPYEQGAIASSLMIIRPGPHLDRRYAYVLLTSPFGKDQLKRFDNGTAQPNLSAASVKKYQIPLPRLAEQTRIVAKVNELVALCEALQAKLVDASETQRHLADAIIERTAT